MANEPADNRLSGTLHVFVAFDWGDAVDLAEAAKLAPSTAQVLARRSRTPASIAYQPAPLRFELPPITFTLDNQPSQTFTAQAELTTFEFGAVSVWLKLPLAFTDAELGHLAGALAEPEPVVQAARRAIEPLFERLQPAIDDAEWSPLTEEYFVFQFAPGSCLPGPATLLHEKSAWLAGLVRLEDECLSTDEVDEALRVRIGYSPDDLLVAEWSAALLLDRACDETLQTIEFANLQLLEFRHIDDRLEKRLASAARMIHPHRRSWIPVLKHVRRRLRDLGELRIEAHDLYERTGSALKLVGDPYLARVYQMLATRFHLGEWQKSIEQSLSVVEGAYQVVSDEADTNRSETLEWIVIGLIAFEIGISLFGRH